MRLAAFLAGVLVALTGCGGTNSGGPGTTAPAVQESTPSSAAATATPAPALSPAAAGDATTTSTACLPPPVDPKAAVSLGIEREGDLLGLCAAWSPAAGGVRGYRVTFFFPETGEEISYETAGAATSFSMPEPDWRVVSDDVTCLAYSTRGVRVEAISAAGSASVVGDLVVQSEGCGPGK